MPASRLDHSYYAYLAERIRHGDSDAFTELYTQTYPSMRRYVSWFLKDENLVPDALQEIYIAVYKSIGSLKLDRLLVPWMKQIAYHTCCSLAANQRRQAAREVSVEDGTLEHLAAHAVGEDDPFQAVYDREITEQLRQALDRLPVRERMAFQLRYQQELQLDEIAEFMGVSMASTKRYIQRARTALQHQLRHLRPEGAYSKQ